jgi:hypothetical protein
VVGIFLGVMLLALYREQVKRPMGELRAEGSVSLEGARKGAVWVYNLGSNGSL